jgi:tetratricopeptide (TPR) repeat protein
VLAPWAIRLRVGVLLILGLVAVWRPYPLLAHEGPEHEIEELSALIEAGRGDFETYLERAIEYRVLGRLSEAQRDLEQAIRLNPGALHALRELARIQFLDGKTTEALATVDQGLRLKIEQPADQGNLLVQRAEILKSQRHDRRALKDCDAAIRSYGGNPEWYLLRSDLQRRLKLHRQRVDDLDEGLKQTGAGILAIEKIEAQLDAGQFKTALKAIEPELASARLRAGWLVRRGRARLGVGDKAGAAEDLRAALKEIDTRLDLARPDPSLLLDQAIAQVLLGDRPAALQTYELARNKEAGEEMTERIREWVGP